MQVTEDASNADTYTLKAIIAHEIRSQPVDFINRSRCLYGIKIPEEIILECLDDEDALLFLEEYVYDLAEKRQDVFAPYGFKYPRDIFDTEPVEESAYQVQPPLIPGT